MNDTGTVLLWAAVTVFSVFFFVGIIVVALFDLKDDIVTENTPKRVSIKRKLRYGLSQSSSSSDEFIYIDRVNWYNTVIFGISDEFNASVEISKSVLLNDMFPSNEYIKSRVLVVFDSKMSHDSWVEPFVMALMARFPGSHVIRSISDIESSAIYNYNCLVIVDELPKPTDLFLIKLFGRVFLFTDAPKFVRFEYVQKNFQGLHLLVPNPKAANVKQIWKRWLGSKLDVVEINTAVKHLTFKDHIVWDFQAERIVYASTDTESSFHGYFSEEDIESSNLRVRSQSENFFDMCEVKME